MRLPLWFAAGYATFALAAACATNGGGAALDVDTRDSTDVASYAASGAASGASSDAASSGQGETTNAPLVSSGAETDVWSAPAQSSDDAGAVALTCDPRKIVCKRAEPSCDYGYVPRIIDGCYGECVRVDECPCNGPDACPDRDRYTCNNSRQRCTPYLN